MHKSRVDPPPDVYRFFVPTIVISILQRGDLAGQCTHELRYLAIFIYSGKRNTGVIHSTVKMFTHDFFKEMGSRTYSKQ